MANNITVAWAIPVDACALGARIETWVETKAAITTLKLSVQHAPSSTTLGKLPLELIENISGCLRQSFFEERLESWEKNERCCIGSCKSFDHFDKEELVEMKDDFSTDLEMMGDDPDDISDGDFEEYLEEDGHIGDKHMFAVDDFLGKIDETSTGRAARSWAKSKKVRFSSKECAKSDLLRDSPQLFAKDFGLEAFFNVFREYDPNDFTLYNNHMSARLLAYLILPSAHSTVKTCAGPGVVSFLSAIVLDPSILLEPSSDRKSLFKVALKSMQLQPKVPDLSFCKRGSVVTHPNKSKIQSLSEKRQEAQALDAPEWPKLMVLGSGERQAGPDDDS